MVVDQCELTVAEVELSAEQRSGGNNGVKTHDSRHLVWRASLWHACSTTIKILP